MAYISMKFGGTSVGTPEKLREACALVRAAVERGKRPVVVISAHNSPNCRMTDTLIASAEKARRERVADPKAATELQRGMCAALGSAPELVESTLADYARLLDGIAALGELSPRTLDVVQSYGERMSAPVVADVLRREFGVDAKFATAYDLGLVANGPYGAAQPDPASYPAIRKEIDRLGGDCVVTTGFIAKNAEGEIVTLGRGGSDYSGAIFGAAVGAEEIQVWTDVNGVMTADPRHVPAARTVPELTFLEASELAWYGAKVLHPATMRPAMEHNIPVRVLNTSDPEGPSTVIVSRAARNEDYAKGICSRSGIELCTVTCEQMLGQSGFAAKLFDVFARHRIDIHIIATSEVSISVTAAKGDSFARASEELRTFCEVDIESDMAIVSVIGENMVGVPGIARRITGALADDKVNIRMISQGAHELNVSLLVKAADARTAVSALHRELFEKSTSWRGRAGR